MECIKAVFRFDTRSDTKISNSKMQQKPKRSFEVRLPSILFHLNWGS